MQARVLPVRMPVLEDVHLCSSADQKSLFFSQDQNAVDTQVTRPCEA